MSQDKVVDVEYERLNNDTHAEYYTINDIAKKIQVEQYIIIFWCNKFKELLQIQSIGDYLLFNSVDLNNLLEIKRLNIDENLSIDDVKKELQKNNKLIVKKTNNQEIALIDFFTKMLSDQNKKIDKLFELYYGLLEDNKNNKEYLAATMDESMKSEIKSLKEHIDIKMADNEEKYVTANESKEIAKLREDMRKAKEKYELLEQDKHEHRHKGLFSRIFKNK